MVVCYYVAIFVIFNGRTSIHCTTSKPFLFLLPIHLPWTIHPFPCHSVASLSFVWLDFFVCLLIYYALFVCIESHLKVMRQSLLMILKWVMERYNWIRDTSFATETSIKCSNFSHRITAFDRLTITTDPIAFSYVILGQIRHVWKIQIISLLLL